jgi:hypothetical protein
MKFFSPASPILLASCILLSGCGSLGLPDFTRHDEVPLEAKAGPRLVETPPPLTGNEAWPRLGDVPFKPETFSPKPVYDHYMNELEYDRAVGADAKGKLEGQSANLTSNQPTRVPQAATQKSHSPKAPVPETDDTMSGGATTQASPVPGEAVLDDSVPGASPMTPVPMPWMAPLLPKE